MKQRLYANRPNLTIGFHGCDQSVVDKVITGKENLLVSSNDYDWLGSGIYFWENNEERAYNWACELSELKDAYNFLVDYSKLTGQALPENKNIGSSTDLLLRKLDCMVIQMAHKIKRKANKRPYDSVRGVFWEGKPLYPNAGFAEKNHIQICICNPNCIKGYFLPRNIDEKYPNP